MMSSDNDDSDSEMESMHDNVFNLHDVDDDQGYYVAMFLQRIIASGELNVLHSNIRDPFYRPKLPKIKQPPVLSRLRKNSISRTVQEACGEAPIVLHAKPPTGGGGGGGSSGSGGSGGATSSSSSSAAASVAAASATAHTPSLLRMITARERGFGLKHASFTKPQRCGINNLHTPNTFKPLMKMESKVYCGALSANGNSFVTASQDHVLRVFDSSRSKYRRINRIMAKDVHWGILDVAFTSKGDEFVYSTWSTCLQVTSIRGESSDIQTYNLQPFTPRFCIFSVAFSSCDQHIIGGSSDGCLYLFDRHHNLCALRAPVAYNGRGITEDRTDVNTVGFLDETSNVIYTGLDNGAIRIWDRRTMSDTRFDPVGYFIGHRDGVTYIDSKMDGRYLISNSKDQTIKLWDIRSFARSSQEKQAIRSRQTSRGKLAWDYRWDEVPADFYESNVQMKNDNSIMTYRGHRVRKSLLRAKFSPVETTGQRYIYTGCATGHLIIYDLLTGAIVRTIDGHRDIVRDVAWHPSRQEILSSSWDGTVNLNSYREPELDNEPTDRPVQKRSHRSHMLLGSVELSSFHEQSFVRRSQRIADQVARRSQ